MSMMIEYCMVLLLLSVSLVVGHDASTAAAESKFFRHLSSFGMKDLLAFYHPRMTTTTPVIPMAPTNMSMSHPFPPSAAPTKRHALPSSSLSPPSASAAAPTSLSSTEAALPTSSSDETTPSVEPTTTATVVISKYGRISDDEYMLTPEQIETFHREGCVTIPNVLTEEEMLELDEPFNRLIQGNIPIPGKDFCDMSKPFGIPYEEWSIVNCMLPTRYYPPLQNNVYERITQSMARQLFPNSNMTKDYDQLLNKRPGKTDAIFSWHQDMAYWPGPAALNVTTTDTCTFSLAVDDSTPENGCLRYVVGSGRVNQVLRRHQPVASNRDEGHALQLELEENDIVQLAPASRGSITIHDEFVVHGSGGNTCRDKSRRTYVVAYRANEIVQAERRIGFTHSHNDVVNWDTFLDGEAHRIKRLEQQQQQQ